MYKSNVRFKIALYRSILKYLFLSKERKSYYHKNVLNISVEISKQNYFMEILAWLVPT